MSFLWCLPAPRAASAVIRRRVKASTGAARREKNARVARYCGVVSTPRDSQPAAPGDGPAPAPRRERVEHPPEYYAAIKQKFAEERDLRLSYRPEGTAQFITDLSGSLSSYETDPYGGEIVPRDPIDDA